MRGAKKKRDKNSQIQFRTYTIFH